MRYRLHTRVIFLESGKMRADLTSVPPNQRQISVATDNVATLVAENRFAYDISIYFNSRVFYRFFLLCR